MYDIIKTVINSGRYELSDMLTKIDTVWVQGDITDDQKTELTALAREKADPAGSYAPLQEQIDTLAAQNTGKNLLIIFYVIYNFYI